MVKYDTRDCFRCGEFHQGWCPWTVGFTQSVDTLEIISKIDAGVQVDFECTNCTRPNNIIGITEWDTKWTRVPVEIWVMIGEKLPLKDILELSRSNRNLYQIYNDPDFCRRKAQPVNRKLREAITATPEYNGLSNELVRLAVVENCCYKWTMSLGISRFMWYAGNVYHESYDQYCRRSRFYASKARWLAEVDVQYCKLSQSEKLKLSEDIKIRHVVTQWQHHVATSGCRAHSL